MTCCIARPVRPIVFTTDDVGSHQQFLEFDCECGSCCKRVALFAPRPSNIVPLTDEWLVKIVADVFFGCKASCYGNNVEVDFKHGVILDLMGDYIRIGYKVIEVVPNGLEGGTIPPIQLGAMVTCCGAGAARGCASRTTEQLNVAQDSGFVVVPIPPFAYAVQFITLSPSLMFSSTTDINFYGSGVGSPMFSTTGNNVADPLVIPNGAQTLAIINNNTTSDFAVEVMFLIGV